MHAAELGYWFSWQAARLKRAARLQARADRVGDAAVRRRLPQRPHAPLPARRAGRDRPASSPTTERARDALLLEGAPAERIEVAPPGIDVERFAVRARRSRRQARHAALDRPAGLGEGPPGPAARARAAARAAAATTCASLIVGVGPEERRLRACARDLGLDDRVELRGGVPLRRDAGGVYAQAVVPRARTSPTSVLGGAVRDGAGRGDGGARAGRRGRQRARSPRCSAATARCSRRATGCGLADALATGPLARPARRRAPAPDAGAARSLLGARRRPTRLATAYARLLGPDVTADVVIVTWRSGERCSRCLEHLGAQDQPALRDRRRQRLRRRHGRGGRERFPAVRVLDLDSRTSVSARPSTPAWPKAARRGGRAWSTTTSSVEAGALTALLRRSPTRAVGMVAGLTRCPSSGRVDGFGIELDATLSRLQPPARRAHRSGRRSARSGRAEAPPPIAGRPSSKSVASTSACSPMARTSTSLCGCALAGWRRRSRPDARGVHLGGATIGVDSPLQRRLSGFARGFLLRRYGVLRTRAALRALLSRR